MKKTLIAAAVAAGLLLAPTAASAQLCVVGIFIAAIQKNATENRELTTKEAMTCGLINDEEGAKALKKGKPAKATKAKKAAKPT